jgi:hypothetical protein
MMNMIGVRSHIYGVSLGGANKLYIGCARFGDDFDMGKLVSEPAIARRLADADAAHEGRGRDWDAFEIESYASEAEASEALDFWRNYFRSLGFELNGDL